MVRVVQSLPLIPGIGGFFLICMVSTGVFFDSLEVLNGFIKQVVDNRRNVGVRKWTTWLREDLGSRACAWLRPDFVPPSPFFGYQRPSDSVVPDFV